MAQGNFFTGTNAGGDTLEVTDGTTINTDVRKIIVSAGTITASSGHTVTITTGGGGGGGGTIGGTIADTQVAFGTAADTIGGEAELTYVDTAGSRKFTVSDSDAGTTTVLYPLKVSRISTGTAALGLGVGLEFEAEAPAQPGVNVVGSIIESISTAGTNAANTLFDLVIKNLNGSADPAITNEVARFTSNGGFTTTSSLAGGTTVSVDPIGGGTVTVGGTGGVSTTDGPINAGGTLGVVTAATGVIAGDGVASGTGTLSVGGTTSYYGIISVADMGIIDVTDATVIQGRYYQCTGASAILAPASVLGSPSAPMGLTITISNQSGASMDISIDTIITNGGAPITSITLPTSNVSSVSLSVSGTSPNEVWSIVGDSGSPTYNA